MIPVSVLTRAAERARVVLGGPVAVLFCDDTRFSAGAIIRGGGGVYSPFVYIDPVDSDELFFDLPESEVVGYRLEPDEGPSYGFEVFRGLDGEPFLYGWLAWSGGEGTDWPLVFVRVSE